MRRSRIAYMLLAVITIYCISCARGITPYEAANGKARCGKYLR